MEERPEAQPRKERSHAPCTDRNTKAILTRVQRMQSQTAQLSWSTVPVNVKICHSTVLATTGKVPFCQFDWLFCCLMCCSAATTIKVGGGLWVTPTPHHPSWGGGAGDKVAAQLLTASNTSATTHIHHTALSPRFSPGLRCTAQQFPAASPSTHQGHLR